MKENKKILIMLLVIGLVIGGATILYKQLINKTSSNQLVDNQNSQNDENKQKQKAYDFTVYDASGNEVNLSDHFGKPIVLNFWASWCPPCQMEMPDFEQMYLELGEDVVFLMINMTDGSRETLEKASQFISEKEYSFPVFYDLQYNAVSAYNVQNLPTTFFIDSEGYLIAYASGAIDKDTLKRGIDLIK